MYWGKKHHGSKYLESFINWQKSESSTRIKGHFLSINIKHSSTQLGIFPKITPTTLALY